MALTFKQKIGKLLIPSLPVTRENFDRIRLEMNALGVNLRNKFNPFLRNKIKKIAAADNLLVNIAAGPFGEKGWVNIDLFSHNNISFRYDCRKKLPFRSESVQCIRAEHVLEHFDINEEVPIFLKEALRVLKKNGVLRIVVPDIQKFINAYLTNTPQGWKEIGFEIENWTSPVYILNHVFRQDGEHKFGYDFPALEKILLTAGFSNILQQKFGESTSELLMNDLPNHRPYSLYVEAIK